MLCAQALKKWYCLLDAANFICHHAGATKQVYAPEPFDVGRILQADIFSEGQHITLSTTGPIEPGILFTVCTPISLSVYLNLLLFVPVYVCVKVRLMSSFVFVEQLQVLEVMLRHSFGNMILHSMYISHFLFNAFSVFSSRQDSSVFSTLVPQ